MYAIERSLRFIRGALLVYGPSFVKRRIWDKEYSESRWDFADHTAGDCVYSYLEKYAKGGSILDLGCGAGNTATELRSEAYAEYLGVDISEACLEKARRRSERAGRAHKNAFVRGDFLSYAPPRMFDVILFRESLYHVPMHRIAGTLRQYSRYLTGGGVFIIRVFTSQRGKPLRRPVAMLRLVETQFPVVNRGEHRRGESTAAVLVLGPVPYVAQPGASQGGSE